MAEFTVNEMLEMQRQLQEKYKDKWEPICIDTGKNKLLWMIGEIGEVADIVKKNGGEEAVSDPELRAHLIEEMADVLMYYHDVMLCYGITSDGKRAVQLQRSDYDKYDLFVGMDSANIRNMHAILGGDPDGKIHKLMDYTTRPGDVADPWYSDRFDIAYRDIYEGCAALLETLV